jgi:hypothetical protein
VISPQLSDQVHILKTIVVSDPAIVPYIAASSPGSARRGAGFAPWSPGARRWRRSSGSQIDLSDVVSTLAHDSYDAVRRYLGLTDGSERQVGFAGIMDITRNPWATLAVFPL